MTFPPLSPARMEIHFFYIIDFSRRAMLSLQYELYIHRPVRFDAGH